MQHQANTIPEAAPSQNKNSRVFDPAIQNL